MEYQKVINLLDNTPNQLPKFRTKTWIEIRGVYQLRGVYNINSDITRAMLKSSLFDYSDPYIPVKEKITITAAGDDAAVMQTDEINKCVMFKNCPFVNCKSEINKTEIDNAKDIDIVMPMYNLIEYSDTYSIKIWKVMAILQR